MLDAKLIEDLIRVVVLVDLNFLRQLISQVNVHIEDYGAS